MSTITDDDYKAHMASVVAEGFTLDPPGFERLSSWTHMLMHLVNARTNFEWVRDHPVELSELENSLPNRRYSSPGSWLLPLLCIVGIGNSDARCKEGIRRIRRRKTGP